MLQNFLTKCGLIFVLFIFLFVFLKVLGPVSLSVNSVSTNKTDVFTVSGEGSVNGQPNLANITVGVEATGSTVKQAQEQINSNINKISQAIKSLGVSSQDIQTSNYNIYPSFNQDQKISGFRASTDLAVKIKDLSQVNSVIDSATANGATNVSGVSFDIDDKSKLEDQAREKAVDQAKQKADRASKIAGFRLGRIINYSEDTSQLIPPPRTSLMSADAGSAKTKIEPGSSQVRITVTLSYEII